MENISKPLKMTQTQTLVFYSEEMITSQAQKWQTTGIWPTHFKTQEFKKRKSFPKLYSEHQEDVINYLLKDAIIVPIHAIMTFRSLQHLCVIKSKTFENCFRLIS